MTQVLPELRPRPDDGVGETAAARRVRLQRLARLVDTRAIAAMTGVSLYRVQELVRLRRDAELVLADVGAGARERAEARRYLADEAIPAAQVGRLWRAGAVWRWAYDTERVDQWAVPQRKAAPGRTAGGPPVRPRHRASLAELAGRYAAVVVEEGRAAELGGVLYDAYCQARAGGAKAAQARAVAARRVAAEHGERLEVCEKVMLRVAQAARAGR